MTTLQVTGLRRLFEGGEFWHIGFEPGLNLLIGDRNSSKTTTLRIIDFCFGDDDNATGKFGPAIADEYSRFDLTVSINGTEHALVRRLKQRGQLRSVDVDGSVMNPVHFNAWIMSELNWPTINIPRGLDYSVTEELPLTFRSLYRHIYRRADSWTEFASREFEYYRRAVLAFFLGVAEETYGNRTLQVRVRRAENELAQLEQRRRELLILIDDIVHRATEGYGHTGRSGLSNLQDVMDSTRHQREELERTREQLSADVRTNPGYDAEQDRKIKSLNDSIARIAVDVSGVERILREQQRLIATLDGDRLRIQRALVSSQALSSILVSVCPACYQRIAPPVDGELRQGEDCYVCGQEILVDARQRRLALEEQAVQQEQAELKDVVKGLEDRLGVLREEHAALIKEREDLLTLVEKEREAFITPVLREFERVQFRLGQLAQREELLERLSQLQRHIDDVDAQREVLVHSLDQLNRDALARPSIKGLVVERTNLLANEMNKFINRLPTEEGVGGLISIDPEGFTFYVGQEEWNNALGDERRVLFFLAYHYAFLKLASEHLVPHPGLAVLDNPFQQDVPPHLVEAGIAILQELCADAPDLQVLITTRRNLTGISANRIEFNRVFNPDHENL